MSIQTGFVKFTGMTKFVEFVAASGNCLLKIHLLGQTCPQDEHPMRAMYGKPTMSG